MKTAVIYIHGKGGSPKEAEHYRPLFPESEVIGFDWQSDTPWDAEKEFREYFEKQGREYDSLILIANSIGAYFALHALDKQKIARTYLISPVIDMESLILGMMAQEGINEAELKERSEIVSASGEVLSWKYLCYAREHPLTWKAETYILYGDQDFLTPYETVRAFAEKNDAELTVMKGGEHWFHTEEQMDFLDEWIRQSEESAGIRICAERISAEEYTSFLKRSDLGFQYPKERFEERIKKLVNHVSISLIARNQADEAVGVLFALTDYAYWMFVTDLGVDRRYERKGIGKKLMKKALETAGGEKDIIVYLAANEDALGFYEKLGMKKADDIMCFSQNDWTPFKVE